MEFRFTPEEERFRAEVQGFLKQELPADLDDYDQHDHGMWSFAREFTKRLATKGWVVPHWPKEYGGAGLSVMEQLIYNEEVAYARAPVVNGQGVNLAGPTLIVHGSDEQKREHLPGIAGGEIIWSQGYSEPGSGSDLASLQTRAVRDGDDYVINGQKIWTSNAHWAQWMFMLARTDPDAPKHRGISFLLLDMTTPGITVQPLISLANQHRFNQVFFDNVRVPARNRVGEENRGWYVSATLLDFERSNIGSAAIARRTLEDLNRYAREAKADGRTPFTRAEIRHRLADLWIDAEAGRYMSYRVASMQNRGMVPNSEASQAKLFHSQLIQRIANTGVFVLGLHGQLKPESRHARLKGHFEHLYLTTVSNTLMAGTSEIQRNIIATRGLGLPRG